MINWIISILIVIWIIISVLSFDECTMGELLLEFRRKKYNRKQYVIIGIFVTNMIIICVGLFVGTVWCFHYIITNMAHLIN